MNLLKLDEVRTKSILWINLCATVGLFCCLLYYGFLFKRAMEWNRDLQERLQKVEMKLHQLEER